MDLNNLPVSIISDLKKIGKEKKLNSLQSLILYKENANKVFLILSGGAVLLHVHPKTLKERAINFFIPNFHPFASIAEAFYLDIPSEYHLKTFTNTHCIEITKERFIKYINSTEKGLLIQELGIRSLLEKNTLRANLISLSSTEMLQHLHKTHPQILQQVPSKYVADFLGISPQWLSKLKHKL